MGGTYWHATPGKNLPGILKNGLIPSVGPRSAACGEDEPRTYLFADRAVLEDAMAGWLGDELDGQDPVILEITGLPNNIRAGSDPDSFETTTQDPIPPECIRVLDI